MKSRGWSDAGTIEEMERDCYRIEGLKLRTVLDIGANIGSFARQVCQLNPQAHVWCYEPEPENFALLVDNTHGLSVTLEQAAVWANGGGVEIAAQRGLSHVCDGTRCRVPHEPPVPVNSRPLDEILAEHESVDLLKMDVEGAEFAILDACPLSALRKIKYLRMEIHDYEGHRRRHKLYERLSEVFTIRIEEFVPNDGGLWLGERR